MDLSVNASRFAVLAVTPVAPAPAKPAVSSPVVDSDFNIVVHYSGDATYQPAFTQAVARWTQVIVADIPAFISTQYGVIDDLLIDASIEPIDGAGGILGQAGPDLFRDGSLLPAHGVMKFDSADVAQMFAGGSWTTVILHEIGHILGLGTIWTDLGLKNRAGDYIGPHALAEYRTLSGNAGAAFIPIEHDGGPGTAGGHWDEETFGAELMTGYVEAAGTAMPLSRMTIGSLQDIGYSVNYAAADPYVLPGTTPASPADDYADSLSDQSAPLGQIAVNGSSTGRLEVVGDHDWFRVQLAAGTTYVIDLRGSHSASGTLDDPYLRLRASNGALLAENDDIVLETNTDSRLTFTASTSGTYYVDAGAYNNSLAGTYRVAVSIGGQSSADDFADSLSDTTARFGTLAIGGASTGMLETAGDRDWFRVQLVAGTHYEIDLQGQAHAGTLEDPYLRVYDGHGTLVAENDDITLGVNRDSRLFFQAAVSGFYYFAAGAFDDNYTGTYRLAATANNTVIGDGGNNILIGTAADDTMRGFGGNDRLTARAGNDELDGGAGNDISDGGPGDDTAVFSGNLGAYTPRDVGIRIDISGPDGNDILRNVEHLRFADGTVNVSDGNPLFDTLFYDRNNPDVFHAGADALAHFNASGWHEGRDPNPFFSVAGYLGANPDVRAAGVNPLDHYHQNGWREGRDPSPNFDTTLYLIHNPDVAAAGTDPLEHYLQHGRAEGRAVYTAVGQSIVGGFDAEYYLFHNPDVAAAGVDPLQHYNTYGWREGRNPNAYFDSAGYLAHYPDIAAAGVNPLQHYEQSGWKEGRDPSAAFDTLHYLAAYPDIAVADVNPLDHFLRSGIYEGRSPFGDGIWHA